MNLIFILFTICVSFVHGIENGIQVIFKPTDIETFSAKVVDRLNVELCSFSYSNDKTDVFSEESPCSGPFVSHYDIRPTHVLNADSGITLDKKSNLFRVIVGIRNPSVNNKYSIIIDGTAHGVLQSPAHYQHRGYAYNPNLPHGPPHHGHHIRDPFGEPVFNFLSRKGNPLKGHELKLKKRHILKANHLADFDWELITNPGCQFVGPHVNPSNCSECKSPAVPFEGPSSEHRLCVLDNDDLARWHREDFLAVYEVRREQFIDAYARYEDQIEHYRRIKAAYDVVRKAIVNQTDYIQAGYQNVVDEYHDKAWAVYNQTVKEYQLLHQLEFAMDTAKEVYTAACQAFINGLYDSGTSAPVFSRKHLATFNKFKLRSAKPVMDGIHEILNSGAWKDKTFSLMKTIDNQIRHLLK